MINVSKFPCLDYHTMLSYANPRNMAHFFCLAVALCFLWPTSTNTVLGIKPHFVSEPAKVIATYQDETVAFTWKLSNHSINRLYFGTWQMDHDTLGKTIMSIVRNGSATPIYTSEKKDVSEYRGRVRWAGDLSTGVVSFELTNIKQTDQKYYGIEIEFDDDAMTEITGFTNLTVKARSVFTFASSGITHPAHGSAVFTWKYSLTGEDQSSLSALVFGIYRKDTYKILCTIQIKDKAVSSSNCSTGVRKGDVRYSSSSPMSMTEFVLDNLSPEDEGIYSLRLEGTQERMENKTRLFVRGTKPHFTSEPSKLIEKYQDETVAFTWKLSNHSFNRLYFGTWQANHGTLGKTIMSIVRNGSETPIYTSEKKEVSEYRGRVRWAGDLSTGVVSFELTNIKQTDQKYYGIEIEFDDALETEITGFTQLVVNKSKSVIVKVPRIKPHFTSEPAKAIVTYQDETVAFTWKLSNHSINRLYFGTWQMDYGTLGKTIMSIVRNGSETPTYTSEKKEVSEYRGRVRWAGDHSTGVVSFELTNIKQTDQKYYGIEIEFDDDIMTEITGFTQLVVKSKAVVVKETNPCEFNNGGCSHMCDFSIVTNSHTCECPSGMELSSDGKTCEMVSQMTTVSPSPTSGADVNKMACVKTFLFIVVASIIIAL